MATVTHAEKLERMRAHMAALGIPASTAMPPLWKVLWRLGFEVPPPLFMGFGGITLVLGGFFGCFWGLMMWLLLWSREGMSVWFALAAAFAAGVLFGVAMAAYLRRLARRHRLPAWDGYTGQGSTG